MLKIINRDTNTVTELLFDNFGNYVIQKALAKSTDQSRIMLLKVEYFIKIDYKSIIAIVTK